MDQQPNAKIRLVAMAATVIALLAISIPFVFEDHVDAEPAAVAASDPMAPVASHGDEQGGACMADAKPAKLDFTMKDLDGKDVSLSSFKGKVILLNFWATWCGPCKAEIPEFVELQKQYGKDGLVIVGYSVDDEAPKARAFANEYKMRTGRSGESPRRSSSAVTAGCVRSISASRRRPCSKKRSKRCCSMIRSAHAERFHTRASRLRLPSFIS
jgi:thiol-disulfide isomerase/thioredoxin